MERALTRGRVQRVDGVWIVPCRRCGESVQSSLEPVFRTKYTETILCWCCGADNSVRPPLAWRLAYGLKNARKRRRIVGWLWWTKYPPWKCWMMPYEITP